MLLKSISFGLLFVLIVINLASSAYNNEYVLMEFEYTNGEFSLIDKSLEYGFAPQEGVQREYEFRLVSEMNETLNGVYFDPSLLYSDGGQEEIEGGILVLNETRFYVTMPNFFDLRAIEIIRDNNLIFREEVYDVGASSCRIK